MKTKNHWQFIDSKGAFRLENPDSSSYLYFPLVNEAGMMSAVTPTLNGDIKTDQNRFLNLPVSVEDLHNTRSGRNFWIYIDGHGAWSATGNSAAQISQRYKDGAAEPAAIEAGFLWHKTARQHTPTGLQAEIINFIPANQDHVELMRVTLSNLGNQPLNLTPTAAIPLYGRSADNVRDHRHVTSLLNRTSCRSHGIILRPTLSFDERGHLPNGTSYAVLGSEVDGIAPQGFFPMVQTFCGEGGSLDWPEAIVRSQGPTHFAGATLNGYESLGGLQFQKITLQPGAERSYILVLAILNTDDSPEDLLEKYGSQANFDDWLQRTQAHWEKQLSVEIQTSNSEFDRWTKWVSLQPILRRLFGNSFLPYHDYGKGGRGWRDLWQDILALLVMDGGPQALESLSETLYNHFAGVRIDGSNATIIGSEPGEFKADRNNIPRVWMDHGAWPWLTTRLYLDQTGDLEFLLRQQTYFKDHLVSRARSVDADWQPEQGTQLRTDGGEIYRGSILEHLVLQHLTPFFNVGEHNLIRLEGADWNDGMDMASERGESAAFTALYASNFHQLSQWTLKLKKLGVEDVEIAREMLLLLDSLSTPVDYGSVAEKTELLAAYFESCRSRVSGEKSTISLEDLSRDLENKSRWLTGQLRSQEWIRNQEGYGWFNGYYDDDGNRLEGDHPNGVRMTLTGQVFTLMGGIATEDQADQIVQAADRYLLDPDAGGYRLNTDFGEVLMNMGRCFGFAFGHKENGAVFNHMAVMYAYALYHRGFIRQGYQILSGIFEQCRNFPTSRMYPGIPEYFNDQGRGMYPYLTGSASWYMLTLVTEAFGVKGWQGDLLLQPKLVREQFDETGRASIHTSFAGRPLEITYRNPEALDAGTYLIASAAINREPFEIPEAGTSIYIPRQQLSNRSDMEPIRIDVTFRKGN